MSDQAGVSLSPIEQLSFQRFLGHTFVQERVVTVSNLVMTRIEPNTNRVSWELINEGANDIRVSNFPTVTAASGWLLSFGGGVILQDWAEDGEGVSYPIYMLAVGAASDIRLREVIRL